MKATDLDGFFELKRWFRHNWLILIGVFVCIYFVYHAFAGERGIMRYVELKSELRQATKKADIISAERSVWEDKVKRLSPNSLDLDMLDEVARDLLNMGKEGDFLIIDIAS